MTAPEPLDLASNAAPLPTRRVDAARHLLKPHLIRDCLTWARQPSLRNAWLAGLQAAVVLAIGLPAAYLSPWPHLIGYASLGALVALFGRFSPRRSRGRVVLFAALCQTSAVFVMSMAVWGGAPLTVQMALLALACGVFFFVAVTGQFGPPGALIFVFAAGAAMAPLTTFAEVLERTIATGTVSALSVLICAGSEFLRHHPTEERPFPVEPERPLDHRLIAAGRIVVGAAVAIFASSALGMRYPVWAAMGALAVLQGAHLHISMNRALQRMAGTVVGALVAWIVLTHEPSVWAVILILIGLQLATEMIIGSNYGLGQVLVTPMALLMTHLASPHTAGAEIAPERVMDTLLGAGIGIVIAVFLSSLDDRHHLAQQHAARTAAPEPPADRG